MQFCMSSAIHTLPKYQSPLACLPHRTFNRTHIYMQLHYAPITTHLGLVRPSASSPSCWLWLNQLTAHQILARHILAMQANRPPQPIKAVLLAVIKPIHHTPTPDSGHAGQSTSKQASAVDMPDTHHSRPVHLQTNSSQLNGLMQLETSESRPTRRAMDALPRCVTVPDRNLAQPII